MIEIRNTCSIQIEWKYPIPFYILFHAIRTNLILEVSFRRRTQQRKAFTVLASVKPTHHGPTLSRAMLWRLSRPHSTHRVWLHQHLVAMPCSHRDVCNRKRCMRCSIQGDIRGSTDMYKDQCKSGKLGPCFKQRRFISLYFFTACTFRIPDYKVRQPEHSYEIHPRVASKS